MVLCSLCVNSRIVFLLHIKIIALYSFEKYEKFKKCIFECFVNYYKIILVDYIQCLVTRKMYVSCDISMLKNSSMTWGHKLGANIKISCITQDVDNAHDCTIIKRIPFLATVSKLIQLVNKFFDKQCVLSKIRASCLHWMYIYLIYKHAFFYKAWVFEITQKV